MMDIRLIVVGKIKEKYLEDAISEYQKRIKPMANLQVVEVKEVTLYDENDTLIANSLCNMYFLKNDK